MGYWAVWQTTQYPLGARRLERHDPRRDLLRRAARAGRDLFREPVRHARLEQRRRQPRRDRDVGLRRRRAQRRRAPDHLAGWRRRGRRVRGRRQPGEPETVRQRGRRRLRQVALRRRRPRLGGRHQPGRLSEPGAGAPGRRAAGVPDHRAGRRRQQQRRHRRGDRRPVVGRRGRRRSDQRHDLHRLGELSRLGGLVPRPAHGRRVRSSVRRRVVAGGLGRARHPQVEAGCRDRFLRAGGQRAGHGRAAELRQRHRLRGRHRALLRQHPALLRRSRRRRLALGRHRHDHLAVVDDQLPPVVDGPISRRRGTGDAVSHL